MSTIRGTDLLLINQGSQSFKLTAGRFAGKGTYPVTSKIITAPTADYPNELDLILENDTNITSFLPGELFVQVGTPPDNNLNPFVDLEPLPYLATTSDITNITSKDSSFTATSINSAGTGYGVYAGSGGPFPNTAPEGTPIEDLYIFGWIYTTQNDGNFDITFNPPLSFSKTIEIKSVQTRVNGALIYEFQSGTVTVPNPNASYPIYTKSGPDSLISIRYTGDFGNNLSSGLYSIYLDGAQYTQISGNDTSGNLTAGTELTFTNSSDLTYFFQGQQVSFEESGSVPVTDLISAVADSGSNKLLTFDSDQDLAEFSDGDSVIVNDGFDQTHYWSAMFKDDYGPGGTGTLNNEVESFDGNTTTRSTAAINAIGDVDLGISWSFIPTVNLQGTTMGCYFRSPNQVVFFNANQAGIFIEYKDGTKEHLIGGTSGQAQIQMVSDAAMEVNIQNKPIKQIYFHNEPGTTNVVDSWCAVYINGKILTDPGYNVNPTATVVSTDVTSKQMTVTPVTGTWDSSLIDDFVSGVLSPSQISADVASVDPANYKMIITNLQNDWSIGVGKKVTPTSETTGQGIVLYPQPNIDAIKYVQKAVNTPFISSGTWTETVVNRDESINYVTRQEGSQFNINYSYQLSCETGDFQSGSFKGYAFNGDESNFAMNGTAGSAIIWDTTKMDLFGDITVNVSVDYGSCAILVNNTLTSTVVSTELVTIPLDNDGLIESIKFVPDSKVQIYSIDINGQEMIDYQYAEDSVLSQISNIQEVYTIASTDFGNYKVGDPVKMTNTSGNVVSYTPTTSLITQVAALPITDSVTATFSGRICGTGWERPIQDFTFSDGATWNIAPNDNPWIKRSDFIGGTIGADYSGNTPYVVGWEESSITGGNVGAVVLSNSGQYYSGGNIVEANLPPTINYVQWYAGGNGIGTVTFRDCTKGESKYTLTFEDNQDLKYFHPDDVVQSGTSVNCTGIKFNMTVTGNNFYVGSITSNGKMLVDSANFSDSNTQINIGTASSNSSTRPTDWANGTKDTDPDTSNDTPFYGGIVPDGAVLSWTTPIDLNTLGLQLWYDTGGGTTDVSVTINNGDIYTSVPVSTQNYTTYKISTPVLLSTVISSDPANNQLTVNSGAWTTGVSVPGVTATGTGNISSIDTDNKEIVVEPSNNRWIDSGAWDTTFVVPGALPNWNQSEKWSDFLSTNGTFYVPGDSPKYFKENAFNGSTLWYQQAGLNQSSINDSAFIKFTLPDSIKNNTVTSLAVFSQNVLANIVIELNVDGGGTAEKTYTNLSAGAEYKDDVHSYKFNLTDTPTTIYNISVRQLNSNDGPTLTGIEFNGQLLVDKGVRSGGEVVGKGNSTGTVFQIAQNTLNSYSGNSKGLDFYAQSQNAVDTIPLESTIFGATPSIKSTKKGTPEVIEFSGEWESYKYFSDGDSVTQIVDPGSQTPSALKATKSYLPITSNVTAFENITVSTTFTDWVEYSGGPFDDPIAVIGRYEQLTNPDVGGAAGECLMTFSSPIPVVGGKVTLYLVSGNNAGTGASVTFNGDPAYTYTGLEIGGNNTQAPSQFNAPSTITTIKITGNTAGFRLQLFGVAFVPFVNSSSYAVLPQSSFTFTDNQDLKYFVAGNLLKKVVDDGARATVVSIGNKSMEVNNISGTWTGYNAAIESASTAIQGQGTVASVNGSKETLSVNVTQNGFVDSGTYAEIATDAIISEVYNLTGPDYNNSELWSSYGTGTPASAGFAWTGAFNGIIDNFVDGYATAPGLSQTMTWTPPSPIQVNGSVVLEYLIVDTNSTIIVNAGLGSELRLPVNNGGVLSPIRIYPDSLVNITMTSGAVSPSYAYLSRVEVDGRTLIDNNVTVPSGYDTITSTQITSTDSTNMDFFDKGPCTMTDDAGVVLNYSPTSNTITNVSTLTAVVGARNPDTATQVGNVDSLFSAAKANPYAGANDSLSYGAIFSDTVQSTLTLTFGIPFTGNLIVYANAADQSVTPVLSCNGTALTAAVLSQNDLIAPYDLGQVTNATTITYSGSSTLNFWGILLNGVNYFPPGGIALTLTNNQDLKYFQVGDVVQGGEPFTGIAKYNDSRNASPLGWTDGTLIEVDPYTVGNRFTPEGSTTLHAMNLFYVETPAKSVSYNLYDSGSWTGNATPVFNGFVSNDGQTWTQTAANSTLPLAITDGVSSYSYFAVTGGGGDGSNYFYGWFFDDSNNSVISAVDLENNKLIVSKGSWTGSDGTSSGDAADRQTTVTGPANSGTGNFTTFDAINKTVNLNGSNKRWIESGAWNTTTQTGNAAGTDFFITALPGVANVGNGRGQNFFIQDTTGKTTNVIPGQFLIERSGTSFKADTLLLDVNLDNTDLLLINRNDQSFKVSGADLKSYVNTKLAHTNGNVITFSKGAPVAFHRFGYYPLYATQAHAQTVSGDNTSEAITLGGKTYHMPSGSGVTQFKGNYTVTFSD